MDGKFPGPVRLATRPQLQMAMAPMARAANLLLTTIHSSGAPARPPLPLAAIPEGKKPEAVAGDNAGEAATTTSSVQARSVLRRAFEIRQTLLLATPASPSSDSHQFTSASFDPLSPRALFFGLQAEL